jgi:hypothetical protein
MTRGADHIQHAGSQLLKELRKENKGESETLARELVSMICGSRLAAVAAIGWDFNNKSAASSACRRRWDFHILFIAPTYWRYLKVIGSTN